MKCDGELQSDAQYLRCSLFDYFNNQEAVSFIAYLIKSYGGDNALHADFATFFGQSILENQLGYLELLRQLSVGLDDSETQESDKIFIANLWGKYVDDLKDDVFVKEVLKGCVYSKRDSCLETEAYKRVNVERFSEKFSCLSPEDLVGWGSILLNQSEVIASEKSVKAKTCGKMMILQAVFRLPPEFAADGITALVQVLNLPDLRDGEQDIALRRLLAFPVSFGEETQEQQIMHLNALRSVITGLPADHSFKKQLADRWQECLGAIQESQPYVAGNLAAGIVREFGRNDSLGARAAPVAEYYESQLARLLKAVGGSIPPGIMLQSLGTVLDRLEAQSGPAQPGNG